MARRRKSAASDDAAYETSDMSAAAPAGYEDRMMRSRKGMDAGAWSGRSHFRCPRCGRDTFNEREAKSHRC